MKILQRRLEFELHDELGRVDDSEHKKMLKNDSGCASNKQEEYNRLHHK
jgi:hypothetical protein